MKSTLLIETAIGVFMATEIAGVLKNKVTKAAIDERLRLELEPLPEFTAIVLTTGGAHVPTTEDYDSFVGELDAALCEWEAEIPARNSSPELLRGVSGVPGDTDGFPDGVRG